MRYEMHERDFLKEKLNKSIILTNHNLNQFTIELDNLFCIVAKLSSRLGSLFLMN